MFAVLSICMAGCETPTQDLIETDEYGKTINNRNINIPASLIEFGLKGYIVDSVYTEFEYYRGKGARIASIRKGIADAENSRPLSVRWNDAHPKLSYSGSSIIYIYDGLQSDVMLNAYGFAESVTNRYVGGGLHSIVMYWYNSSGYLTNVRIERAGQEPVTVSIQYSADSGVTIYEGGEAYYLAYLRQNDDGVMKRVDNAGYICNVLSHINAPLTSAYVIIPDLYYCGIYGTPVKYLPENTTIERGSTTANKAALTRIGNWQFFYE